MIEFRQKIFSKEYDALRQLSLQLKRDNVRIDVIRPSDLAAVLRGNNVVIERFMAKSKLFGKDEYIMYLKLGAKVKMPENVRLPQGRSFRNDLGYMRVGVRTGISQTKGDKELNDLIDKKIKDKISKVKSPVTPGSNPNQQKQKNASDTLGETTRQRLFGNNNNGGGGGGNSLTFDFSPNIRLGYDSNRLLGNVIEYDKQSRTVVIQFKTISDAVRSLDVLPFGLEYRVYLLDS